ncbi:MAG TPA: permease [Nocardioides sp.]
MGVLAVLFVVGLAWAKWLPYVDKSLALSDSGAWDGSAIFLSSGDPGATPSLAGAWQFTSDYFLAVWKAALVALLIAAGIDALVPRAWLLRLMDRPGRLSQSLTGGSLSLPSMMCTCCTAPVAVGLRRSGVPTSAGLAYWIGNPLLNPAVLVFLFLVLPWQIGTVRLLVGVLLVFGATALVARWLDPVTEPSSSSPDVPETPALRELPGRYLRSLVRFAVVLIPEYVVIVFLTGLLSGWLSDFAGLDQSLGAAAVLLVALVGTALVIPTGGEIPVLAALLAVGAGMGTIGALLITLPALSVPSMVMVAKAFSWRTTLAMSGAVVGGGLVAGGALALML